MKPLDLAGLDELYRPPGKLVLEVKFTEFLPKVVQQALPVRAHGRRLDPKLAASLRRR